MKNNIHKMQNKHIFFVWGIPTFWEGGTQSQLWPKISFEGSPGGRKKKRKKMSQLTQIWVGWLVGWSVGSKLIYVFWAYLTFFFCLCQCFTWEDLA